MFAQFLLHFVCLTGALSAPQVITTDNELSENSLNVNVTKTFRPQLPFLSPDGAATALQGLSFLQGLQLQQLLPQYFAAVQQNGFFENATTFLSQLSANSPLLPRILRPQFGQLNGTAASILPYPLPSRPMYTTLPFENLNVSEFASLFDNLSNFVKPAPDQDDSDANSVDTQLPVMPTNSKLVSNNGGTPILADLNFYTVQQLMNMLGRRR